MTMGREGGRRRTLSLEIILYRKRAFSAVVAQKNERVGELESLSLARAQILANDETQRLATRLLNMCQDMQPRGGENATDQWRRREGGKESRREGGPRGCKMQDTRKGQREGQKKREGCLCVPRPKEQSRSVGRSVGGQSHPERRS